MIHDLLKLVYIDVKMLLTATCDSHYCTCLRHLGWCNTDRIVSIGQGK